MTEDDSQLSRRNVLAGLGTIGVGGALVGAGTSAFFSDGEKLPDNHLVAGELNLVVDWENRYDSGDGLVPIDAFPDAREENDHDGSLDEEFFADEVCGEILEEIEETDPRESKFRTPDYRSKPVLGIEDVKPGDCGLLRLSYHLCGNDGWVWFRTKNKEYDGKLAEKIDATLRYGVPKTKGDGDEEAPVITEGSLEDVLDELNDGLLLDGEPTALKDDENGTGCVALDTIDSENIADFTGGDLNDIDEIDDGTEFTFTIDDEEVVIELTEVKREDDDQVGFDWEVVDGDVGICRVVVGGGAIAGVPQREMTEYDCEGDSGGVTAYAAENPRNPNRTYFQISNITFWYCTDEPTDVPACTPESNTRFLILEWCLPTSVGNEVQRDRVDFDMQFYTEQCRHNDDPPLEWPTDRYEEGK